MNFHLQSFKARIFTGFLQTILPVTIALGAGILYYLYVNFSQHSSSTNQKKRRMKLRQPLYERVSRIRIVTSAAEWDKLLPELLQSVTVIRAVGFDCEWVTHHRVTRPVALIQIAADDGLAILVRLHLLDNVPGSLSQFLANRSILKIGVAVNEDAARLYKDYGLHVSGCVDLRHVTARVRIYRCEQLSLDGIVSAVLGKQLPKNLSIRCGNWESSDLSTEQITYAANDALAAIDVFVQLVLAKMRKKTRPAATLQRETCRAINTMASSVVQGLVDLPYKTSKKHMPQSGDNAMKHSKPQTSYQRQKRHSCLAFSPSRQTPFYHNCRLLAPDGQALCTTSETKIQWYLDKGLADKVSCDPLTACLRFEPSGRPENDNDYYLHAKDNICVVCGGADTYIRKLVVPHEYRKYFPDIMKDHLSHDVLLLCPPCHAISSQHDAQLRQKLVTRCSAPLNNGRTGRTREDRELQQIRSAARALKHSYNKIPIERRELLQRQIMDFYGVSVVDEDVVNRALELDINVKNENYICHGEKVVSYFRDHDSLVNLELMWRQHFVDSMQPAFLPPNWSVHHNHDRLTNVH